MLPAEWCVYETKKASFIEAFFVDEARWWIVSI
jgi:hypothetical protein